jgi:hypothetical protein
MLEVRGLWSMSRWRSAILVRVAITRDVARRGDSLLFLHSLCFAAFVPLLSRLPLPRLRALLEPAPGRPRATPDERGRIVASLQAMLRAGRPLVRTGCLTRGLTLYYFLRRAGVDVALCFGIGRAADTKDGFDGHCWLVLDGEPFLEQRDPFPLYTEMYVFRGVPSSVPADGCPTPSRGRT